MRHLEPLYRHKWCRQKGILKNTHVTAGEAGDGSKTGLMVEGEKRDEHVETIMVGQEEARLRMLLYLNLARTAQGDGTLFQRHPPDARERRMEK
jgi:hypothetical protein